MYPSQLLKGTYQTLILNVLRSKKRMYGYEISQVIKDQSAGEILLPEGSLYPILHKMAEEGLVHTERVLIGGRVRRYYSLTPQGAKEAAFKINELMRFIKTIHILLAPGFRSA